MGRIASITCALVLLLLAGGCQRGSTAAGVSLLDEDFGAGIRLYTLVEEARSAAGSSSSRVVEVVSADELAGSTPHARVNRAADLVLAIPRSGPHGERVYELRCYAGEAASSLTLLGQPWSQLTPDAADALLKAKGSRVEASGETHIDYALGGTAEQLAHRLTLSFRAGGGCASARLRLLDAAPPRF